MNAILPLFASTTPADKPVNILAAARSLTVQLTRSRPLDRKLMASAMTMSFGGSDAEGCWSWRDAYDAMEAALVMQIRRLKPQIERLEDAPAEITALLKGLTALTLTHSRRSEEQVALDQFSSPPELAALAVLAAQVRPGDKVLEPSAGNGLIAILAEACGGEVHLNELAENRAGILAGLFPNAPRTQHDAVHLPDLLTEAGAFHACVANPPFQVLSAHLHSAIATLADGGRLSAIVPVRVFEDAELLSKLRAKGTVRAMIGFPQGAYAKHGTGVETGLIVIDRGQLDVAPVRAVYCETLADAAKAAAGVAGRPTAQPRERRAASIAALFTPKARTAGSTGGKLAFLANTTAVDYALRDWTGEGRDVGLYQAYSLGRIEMAKPRPHPSHLVESGPMASVPPPAPTYRPLLPDTAMNNDRISDAQLETIIYAGEAHSSLLPGNWKLGDAAHIVELAPEGFEKPLRFRRGFFLGDGTGAGKGRTSAGALADNMAQGRLRAVWLSKNETLVEDARRDWTGIGGLASDITPQSAWKQGDAIRMDRGILFTTYATLRQPARGNRPSRLDQIVNWLGEDFDGLIVFDEAHAMANAAGGKGNRGTVKASQQGMAGLALQNRLPDARILYVSATGATTPENLAYAARLGLWGGPEAPFATREDFMEAVSKGGVAMMELIARELKAMGLYIARSLSFEGVEYEPLRHELTVENIEIWDSWADAFQIIHKGLDRALQAVGVKDEDGKTVGGQALSSARSAFEGAKLRFMSSLMSGMKSPTLAESIREDLARGECSVVQIVTTGEAVMERRLSQIAPEDWNDLSIDLSPKDVVLDYLKGAFPTVKMEAVSEGDEGAVVLVPLIVDGKPVESQEALAIRDGLIESLAGLPAVNGVLDQLLDTFGADQVAEITGRSRRCVLRNGRRVVERRSESASRSETDQFMSGKKRILVFSDAGGTGRSYHADLASGNAKARRNHYLVEPGFRADMAVQGLGRTHRTNQASAPLFRPVTTDIKGEKRFLSTIARRLDGLGALTKGERRTAGNGLFNADDNLESPWARQALLAFYLALQWGEVECMTLAEFEDKTGLNLRDGEGNMKDSEQLPPMHTWLNRLLAMRIDDQNALFAEFDKILQGILERVTAAGELDRGMEDIRAEDLEVISEDVVRKDVVTGAETRIVKFSLMSKRELTSSADILDWIPDDASRRLVVNKKSGRAGVVQLGLTLTGDDNRMVKAVRVNRPEGRKLIPLSEYEDSAWEEAHAEIWRATWDAEVAAADPFHRRDLTLVTGLLLPVWRHLPTQRSFVKRIKAPDGRRWLGRVLDEVSVHRLKVALGLTDTADAFSKATDVEPLILERNSSFVLTGGMRLKRSKVMDRMRVEIMDGGKERATLLQLGVQTEMISYQVRYFCPVGSGVLQAVLSRFPVADIWTDALAA